jgi:dephospho-CoA kinase
MKLRKLYYLLPALVLVRAAQAALGRELGRSADAWLAGGVAVLCAALLAPRLAQTGWAHRLYRSRRDPRFEGRFYLPQRPRLLERLYLRVSPPAWCRWSKDDLMLVYRDQRKLLGGGTLALAALVQAMMRELCEHFEAGKRLSRYPFEMLDENKWLAARHGLEGELIDLPDQDRVGVRALARRLLDRMREHAQDLGSAHELEALNDIVHPEVERLRAERVDDARARGDRIVVCDIPLLFEKKMVDRFDRIVLVDAPRPVRLERLVGDRGLRETEAMDMIAAQMPAELKRARADVVIDNTGTMEELEARAAEVWTILTREAARRDSGGARRVTS